MDGLYTNRNVSRDFHTNAFAIHSRHVVNVHVAVAFLTDANPLLELADAGVLVRVIVRLGFPTHPRALALLLKHDRVLVHATTSTAFHPKLYLFEDRCAVIGSANLTNAGMHTNQEISVEVPSEDPRYSELADLFNGWWDRSDVLSDELLEAYRLAWSRHSPSQKTRDLEKAVEQLAPGNLSDVDLTPRSKPTRMARDFEQYRKTYQEFLAHFNMLRDAYERAGVRSIPALPLRLEIDAFLGWLREKHAHGESPDRAIPRTGAAFESHLAPLLAEWHDGVAERWADGTWLKARYESFQTVLGTEASIRAASQGELIDALLQAHAVGDRLRYYKGGRPTQRANMVERMPEERLRNTLTFLLHGKQPFIERLARCIRDPNWRVQEFGRSGVQEVYGWVNSDEIPICNERTLKSMRWLGLPVRVLG